MKFLNWQFILRHSVEEKVNQWKKILNCSEVGIFSKDFICLKKIKILLIEREREHKNITEHKSGGGEREREMQTPC